MNRLLQKLVMSFTVVIMLLVIIVSSTLAWFNSNSTGELNKLTLGVEGNMNLQFSLDNGVTWKKQFDGNDIYRTMSDYYESVGENATSSLFYTLVAKGGLANSVVYGKNEKKYNFDYKLVTPLPTEKGFIAKFFKVEQSRKSINADVHFNNLTDYYYTDIENENYRYYSPQNGYIKLNVKVKSDRECLLLFKNSYVSVNDNYKVMDLSSVSTLRIGFSSDYITRSKCNENHVHDNNCEYLIIHEPVKDFSRDLIMSSEQQNLLNRYLNGFMASSTGYGYYYNERYTDRLYEIMKRQEILVNKDEHNYKINTNYQNQLLGEFDTSLDQVYQLTYLNEAIENSECGSYLSQNETIILNPNTSTQDFTIYIWCEGWDGCAGDFSGLGEFYLSFSFIGIEL